MNEVLQMNFRRFTFLRFNQSGYFVFMIKTELCEGEQIWLNDLVLIAKREIPEPTRKMSRSFPDAKILPLALAPLIPRFRCWIQYFSPGGKLYL